MPHGVSKALLLRQMIKFNSKELLKYDTKKFVSTHSVKAKYGQISDELGLGGNTDDEKINLLIKAIENLLGEEGKGFYYLMEKLQQERLIVALETQIEAECCLDLTVKYVKERKAFGGRIADFQNTQFKLAEMATEIELGRNYIQTLLAKHIANESIVKEVSMAKWWISEMAKRVVAECLQLHGGYGYYRYGTP